MTRDIALVKAALEAAFRVCPTMSTAQANILALTNSHERLAAIAAWVHEQEEVTVNECISCGERDDEQCPKSKRQCGHHCNHSWSHDGCCWCGKEFEEGNDEPR